MKSTTSPHYQIEAMTERHISSFHKALDSVAKEKKYLIFTEAPPIESTKEFVQNCIKNDIAQFVATVDGNVVGWADIRPAKKEDAQNIGYLGMGITKEHRGRGLGKKLVQACLAKAKSKGMSTVRLSVFASNHIAQALYQKMGFKVEGTQEKAYKVGERFEDTIKMTLSLDNTPTIHNAGR